VKTLLIVGEFDSDNVGDQLIGEGHAVLFADAGWRVVTAPLEPPKKITSTVSDPSANKNVRGLHRRLYGRSVWYRHLVELASFAGKRERYMRHARESLDGVEFLVIGGGQLLSDGTLRMMKRLLFLMIIAKQRRMAVAAFGTGASEPRTLVSKFLLRAICRRLSSKSWFRDAGSISIAKRYASAGVLSDMAVPDCAIARAVSLGKATRIMAESRVVGIAPMSEVSLRLSSSETAESDSWWGRVISLLNDRGYQPVLFCSGVSADHRRCVRIASQAESLGLRVELARRPESPEELIGLLAKMGHMLSQRLHASISYYSIGLVPTSVSWDPKVNHFFDGIGVGRRVIAPVEAPEQAVEILLSDERPTVLPERLVELAREMAAECLRSVSTRGDLQNA
jgi:polysaccharide pyruvyl transferase WcaK-like protein